MKGLNISHKKLLSELVKSGGKLDSYTLYRRSRFSFAEFSLIANTLSENELVRLDDDNVYITKKGRGVMISMATIENGNYEWREVPESFKAASIEAGEPYTPNRKLLDKITFNLDRSEVD